MGACYLGAHWLKIRNRTLRRDFSDGSMRRSLTTDPVAVLASACSGPRDGEKNTTVKQRQQDSDDVTLPGIVNRDVLRLGT